MKINKYRLRYLKFSDEKRVKFRVPVYYCDCSGKKRYHTVLPDFMIPYKQYAAVRITQYIFHSFKVDNCTCAISTIRNWKKWYYRNYSRFKDTIKIISTNTRYLLTYVTSLSTIDLKKWSNLSKICFFSSLFSEIGNRLVHILNPR